MFIPKYHINLIYFCAAIEGMNVAFNSSHNNLVELEQRITAECSATLRNVLHNLIHYGKFIRMDQNSDSSLYKGHLLHLTGTVFSCFNCICTLKMGWLLTTFDCKCNVKRVMVFLSLQQLLYQTQVLCQYCYPFINLNWLIYKKI